MERIPFKRPAQLATDTAGTTQVVAHAVKWHWEEEGILYENVCCLYATAAFQEQKILKGMRMLTKRKSVDLYLLQASYASQFEALKLDNETGYTRMREPNNFQKEVKILKNITMMQVNFIGEVQKPGYKNETYLKTAK